MKMRWLVGLASIAIPFLASPSALAQQGVGGPSYAAIVSSCGAASLSGAWGALEMTVTGNLCTNASGSGGGTSSAFGATFPANGTAAGAEYLSTLTSVVSGQMNPLYQNAFGALWIDTQTSNNNLYNAIISPLSTQITHNVLIGAIEGNGTAGSSDTHVVSVQGVAGGTPVPASADPCAYNIKLFADFESTTSGGSIITAASGKRAYICGLTIVTSAAANISLIEGTGSSVCTGGTLAGVYLNTGTTAANGAAFAANGGVARGDGAATLAANATANQNICVLFTTTNSPQVNVHVAYVQQ